MPIKCFLTVIDPLLPGTYELSLLVPSSAVVPNLPNTSIGKTLAPARRFRPTIAQIAEIRKRYATKTVSLDQLAAEYNTASNTIHDVVRKRRRFAKV